MLVVSGSRRPVRVAGGGCCWGAVRIFIVRWGLIGPSFLALASVSVDPVLMPASFWSRGFWCLWCFLARESAGGHAVTSGTSGATTAAEAALILQCFQLGVDRRSTRFPSRRCADADLGACGGDSGSHLGGCGRCGAASRGYDAHDLGAADRCWEALLDGLHHLGDLFVRVGVDLVEVFAQPVGQACAFFSCSFDREILIGLASVCGGVAVALIAEAIDRVAGLVGGSLITSTPAGVGILKKPHTLCLLHIGRRLEILGVGTGPDRTHNRRRELPVRHARRRADAYHLIPKS